MRTCALASSPIAFTHLRTTLTAMILILTRQMAARRISVVYTLVLRPQKSLFPIQSTTDFYKALVDITSFPQPRRTCSHDIVSLVLENLDLEIWSVLCAKCPGDDDVECSTKSVIRDRALSPDQFRALSPPACKGAPTGDRSCQDRECCGASSRRASLRSWMVIDAMNTIFSLRIFNPI
jgi:hypothetical protein